MEMRKKRKYRLNVKKETAFFIEALCLSPFTPPSRCSIWVFVCLCVSLCCCRMCKPYDHRKKRLFEDEQYKNKFT